MTIGNDTVQTNLVKVRCFKLQHFEDTGAVNFIRRLADLRVDIIAAKTRCDQFLAILVQQLKCWPVTAG